MLGSRIRATSDQDHPIALCDECPWRYSGWQWRVQVEGHLAVNPTHWVYVSETSRAYRMIGE